MNIIQNNCFVKFHFCCTDDIFCPCKIKFCERAIVKKFPFQLGLQCSSCSTLCIARNDSANCFHFNASQVQMLNLQTPCCKFLSSKLTFGDSTSGLKTKKSPAQQSMAIFNACQGSLMSAAIYYIYTNFKLTQPNIETF